MSTAPLDPSVVSTQHRQHHQHREPVAPLLQAAAEGDQQAWDRLVERYVNLVWSVARSFRLSEADASDVVQTTWLRLLEHMGSIADPERLPGWLATTTRRECIRVVGKGRIELVTLDDEFAFTLADDDLAPLDASLLTEERDVELWECFGRLSERCQRLLRVLMAAEPPAYAQVGEALGMPVGSIGPTRMRCLDRLREITAERGFDFTDERDWT